MKEKIKEKLIELKSKLLENRGKTNTPSRRVLRGKINVLQELLNNK